MFPLARRYARLVRLLTILLAVGRCEASQSHSQPSANVGIAPDQLLRLIVQEVKSEIQPLVSRLTSQIDGLTSRIDGLDSRLIGIESRLNALDFKQDRLDSSQDELVSRVDSTEARFDSRQDELVSRVDSTEARLDSGLDELVSRVNSTEARLYRLDGPRDCSKLPAGAKTGVHLLQPGLDRSQPPVSAYCDLDTDGGGWTVIQRRADVKPRQNFELDWAAYKEGFGKLDSEFWWGLNNMRTMTALPDRRYELRVNLADFDGGRRHATYQQFRVESEADGYRLFVGSYTGDAGDSLRDSSGQKFSTRDRDQDGWSSGNCAQRYTGAWWYKDCYHANLNGPYRSDGRTGNGGVIWYGWKDNSLKDVVMKIRPVI